MADQDGRPSEIISQLIRHVTSSPRDVDINADIFRGTIYPPSLIDIASIILGLRRGGGGGEESAHLPTVVEDQNAFAHTENAPLENFVEEINFHPFNFGVLHFSTSRKPMQLVPRMSAIGRLTILTRD